MLLWNESTTLNSVVYITSILTLHMYIYKTFLCREAYDEYRDIRGSLQN